MLYFRGGTTQSVTDYTSTPMESLRILWANGSSFLPEDPF